MIKKLGLGVVLIFICSAQLFFIYQISQSPSVIQSEDDEAEKSNSFEIASAKAQ